MIVSTILLVLIILAGFYMAWNIGANDVANAMGTSVGSGALTLKRAIFIAAVLEFSGAFFFGEHVSETIQSGIIKSDIFADTPMLLVYGMLAALIATGVWLQIASYYGWPVSGTHAIVGSVIGFGAVVGGVDAIYWDQVLFIVSSWFVSPLCGGIASYMIFSFLRKNILYTQMPIAAAKRLTPAIVCFVFFVLSLILTTHLIHDVTIVLSSWEIFGISLLVGLLAAGISYLLVRRIPDTTEQKEWMFHTEGKVSSEYAVVEKIFAGLQIISACLMAFAHGANDVANAIGPLSAALTTLQSGVINPNTPVPSWTLALGGIGIVTGLATWGWRVIQTIGKKITELTPTRGFAAEFGAAATVLVASKLGLPISTTHTLVGSVIGVGLARGIEALDLSTTRDIALSWLMTIPASVTLSVGIFYALQFIFEA